VFRRVTKWILGPVTRPLFLRMDWRVGAVAANAAADVAGVRAEVAALRGHLPILLNKIASQAAAERQAKRAEAQMQADLQAIRARLEAAETELCRVSGRQDQLDDSTQSALARLEERIARLPPELVHLADERAAATGQALTQRLAAFEGKTSDRMGKLADRVEFVRKETLFELRYSGSTRGFHSNAAPEVVNPTKVGQGGELRVNLGCGHVQPKGYINVDGRRLDGVDVVTEVGNLPFAPGSISELYSAHLLEHFPEEQLTRVLLPYWLSLLKPGGTFRAVVPDADTMIRDYAAGHCPFEDLRRVTFGDQEYDGDFHFNMFTPDSVADLLAAAGLTDVEVVARGRRNGISLEMEIRARRPLDVAADHV